MKITKTQLKQIIKEELSDATRLDPDWVDAYTEKIYNLLVKANKGIETAHKQLAVLARSAKAEKGYEYHDIKPGTLEPVTVDPEFVTGRVDPEHLKEMIKEELESILREIIE